MSISENFLKTIKKYLGNINKIKPNDLLIVSSESQILIEVSYLHSSFIFIIELCSVTDFTQIVRQKISLEEDYFLEAVYSNLFLEKKECLNFIIEIIHSIPFNNLCLNRKDNS